MDEIIGLDVSQQILGNNAVENFVQEIVTEFYPENVGEYLKKKQRLLAKIQRGKVKSKVHFTIE